MTDVDNFVLNKKKRISTIQMINECPDLVKLEVYLDQTSDVVFKAKKINKGENNAPKN